MFVKNNYIRCIYGQDEYKDKRLCAYCTINEGFIPERECNNCTSFRDYIFKVRCIIKRKGMLCEVGSILEVLCELEAYKRHPKRYAVRLNNVIGFYPIKYFEIVKNYKAEDKEH